MQHRDDRLRAFDEPGGIDTFVEVIGHVGHRGVPVFGEPLFEAAGFVVEPFGLRDAAGVEAQARGFGLEGASQPLLCVLIEAGHFCAD